MVRSGVLTKREMICLKYLWEFLRRNKDYQNDYRHIVQQMDIPVDVYVPLELSPEIPRVNTR